MKRLLARLSLRARLTALTALAAAAVFPTGALLLHHDLSGALDDAVTTELQIRADDASAGLDRSTSSVALRADGLVTQFYDGTGTSVEPADTEPFLRAEERQAATRGRIVVDRPVDGVGSDARVLAQPLDAADPGAGAVAVAGSTAPIAEGRRRLVLVLGVVGPVLVITLAALAWLLTGAALRPVRRMTRRADELSLGGPRSSLPRPPGRDEIAELARTLNRMLARTERAVSRERAFIDEASHELRTPIAVLRGELELARMDVTDSDGPEVAVRAIDSALEETDATHASPSISSSSPVSMPAPDPNTSRPSTCEPPPRTWCAVYPQIPATGTSPCTSAVGPFPFSPMPIYSPG